MRCVALLVLAACSDGGGVQISVRENGTGATQVHLYLGTGAPVDRAPIFLADQELGATYASRDPGGDADLAKVTAGAANFLFSPDGDSLTVPLVIAIGFDDQNQIVGAGKLQDVGVPDKGYLSYDLVLDPSAQVTAWDETDPDATPTSKCVALDDQLIVNAHDEDCDGLLDGDDHECDPHVYKAKSQGPRPDQWSCFKAQSSPIGCFAGSTLSCTDTVGQQPSAMPGVCPELSDYCGPLNDCPFVNHDPAGLTPLSYFHCVLPIHDGAVCPTTLTLPPGTQKCWNVLARNDQQSFQNTLVVDGLGDPETFEVLVDNDCDIALKTDGGGQAAEAVAASGSRDTLAALVVADTGVNSGMIIPVHFDIGGDGCSETPVACTWQGSGPSTMATLDRTALCR